MKEVKQSEAIANVSIPVSTKYTINVGRWIRGNNVDKAIAKLEKVAKKEVPLPMVTHKKDVSHKKGIAAGRFPVNVAEHVIKALKLVKSNAKHKGLDENKLLINEFIPNAVFSKNQKSKYKRGRQTYLKIGVVVEK
ncbi:MAG: hypothetical protein JW791_04210 [Nanoarchaeota archaeon]|nr:hypothetical protein [Nanoarchaeota archaeon]